MGGMKYETGMKFRRALDHVGAGYDDGVWRFPRDL